MPKNLQQYESKFMATSITRSFHISMLWQNAWQITTFLSWNLYIRLSIARSHYSQSKTYVDFWLLASESQTYRFYDEKVVICHPLCHNIDMWKFLVILVVIKLYARINIFKKSRFSLIVEQILAFTSSTNLVGKVKSLSPNLKQIA